MKNNISVFAKKISSNLVILSALWMIINLIYVYAILNGTKSYRIESASYIFALILLLRLASGSHQTTSDINKEEPIKYRKLVWYFFPIIIWFLIYVPYINNPFLSDDYVFIARYSSTPVAQYEGAFFRPVFGLIFYIMLKIFGTSSFPFHLLNFILHISCSILVLRISRYFLIGFKNTYIVYIVFLFNPIQPETVVWISGLQELLWVFFFLSAFYLYIVEPVLDAKKCAFIVLFIALSLLSKETAIIFILVFFVSDLFFYKLKSERFPIKIHIINFFIAATYIAIRTIIVGIPLDYFSSLNLFFIKSTISQPFKIFLFPWNQSYIGEYVYIKLLISFFFIFIILIHFLKNNKEFTLFLCFSFILLYAGIIPLYKMFYVAPDLQGSRYLYFSAFGWGLLLSVLLIKIIKHKLLFHVICLVLIFALGYFMFRNLQPWRTAGEIIKSLPANIKQEYAPDNYYGAYILRNGANEFVQLRKYGNTSGDIIDKK
ncbi:MAG: hypothetical protein A2Y62_19815 [Candidatus Fischerbacteria bacterium RBG_13_37_8]|uniref:Glycosyltransferase RgtA/B/C/D-like domain-containing protein n=1 Tax=Candidatus Fischerbacteria bacterium RBG_13_37_8 TaxID=1817863 RepID=A0A1F5VL09_9BACT|nr:MAG: hypothetical protein A2Y62_19815 [Candidatus Fischerbacteria bacterium RBG_13_37_8]